MESQDPQRRRRFIIPVALVLRAKEKGISLDRLQEMVRLSARCTHKDGNRRYEDFIFMVEGNRVVSILIEGEKFEVETLIVYRCVTCKDTGRVQVFDVCGACDGVGCNKCDQGLVPSSIPCQVCALNRMLSYR